MQWTEVRKLVPNQMEDPWDVGEEQLLSFYSHYLAVAHEHMWRPTVSHPNVHCDQARSDLQHSVETTVWATLEGSHSEWHMGEKGVVHLEGVPNTNKEVGLPSLVQ